MGETAQNIKACDKVATGDYDSCVAQKSTLGALATASTVLMGFGMATANPVTTPILLGAALGLQVAS